MNIQQACDNQKRQKKIIWNETKEKEKKRKKNNKNNISNEWQNDVSNK